MSHQTSPVGQKVVSGITGVSPTTVLSAADWQFLIIVLQGNATGTPVIQVPDGVNARIIDNQITTAVSVSVKTSGGTGATVNSATNRWVFVDGAQNANAI